MAPERSSPPPATGTDTLAEESPGDVLDELFKKVEEPRLEDLVPPKEAHAVARRGPREEADAATRRAAPDPAVPVLRAARVASVKGRVAEIAWRPGGETTAAQVPSDVDLDLVRHAMEHQQRLLVECVDGEAPVVVGVVQTRMARDVVLKGETVHIEAEREILLRAGKGALRIREDGAVELLGSRIVATSRGLFRLVGRVLRLN